MPQFKKEVRTGGIPHSRYDMDAVVAADKAMKEGKTIDQAAEIAKKIIWAKKGWKLKKGKGKAPAVQTPEPQPVQPEENAALRRYLISVCRLVLGARGYFHTMTTSELYDCASVADIPIKEFVEEQWQ